MSQAHTAASAQLPAGEFSEWVDAVQRAISGEQPSVVPCGACTACCTSSQFIHIAPDETTTLAHIPKELLFAAPRMPSGHALMGYNSSGHCPMLVDQQCTIYEHRPRTCRTYDCRVFPASGVVLEPDDHKELIARQAQRWLFDYRNEDSRRLHIAVANAAQFLADHSSELGGDAPATATHRAVGAVDIHQLFVDDQPAIEAVRLALRAR